MFVCHSLQLAVLLIAAATTTHAQITNPDALIGRPPAPPSHHEPRPIHQLQWLWQYTEPQPAGNKPNLLADPRFTALLHDDLRAPQSFWGPLASPLADAAQAFLNGPGQVASPDNRHITITGAVADQLRQRGLLWVDAGDPRHPDDPLVVFSALRWNEQGRTPDEPRAPFTLWIFPSRELDPQHLPEALKSALGSFTAADGCHAPAIQAAIVVDPSGMPHILGAIDVGVITQHCNAGSPS